MEYVWLEAWQTTALPVMDPGVDGGPPVIVTERVCAVPAPHTFDPATCTNPVLEPDVAVIDVLYELPDHPVGSVHE